MDGGDVLVERRRSGVVKRASDGYILLVVGMSGKLVPVERMHLGEGTCSSTFCE